MHIIGCETLGIFLAEQLIEVLACIVELRVVGVENRVIADLQHADEVSEVRRVEILPNSLIDEEQASIGVVHKVVNVVGLKLMENRHRNSSESESTKHGDSPLRRVAATKGNLVARFHAGFLKKNVDFCYLSGNILILITDTLEISKGKFFPILPN